MDDEAILRLCTDAKRKSWKMDRGSLAHAIRELANAILISNNIPEESWPDTSPPSVPDPELR